LYGIFVNESRHKKRQWCPRQHCDESGSALLYVTSSVVAHLLDKAIGQHNTLSLLKVFLLFDRLYHLFIKRQKEFTSKAVEL